MEELKQGVYFNVENGSHEVMVQLCFAKEQQALYTMLEQYARELESMYGVSFLWNGEERTISYTLTGIHYPEEEEKAKAFVVTWRKNFEEILK